MDNFWNDKADSLTNAVLKKISKMTHSELRGFVPDLFEHDGALAKAGENELAALQTMIAPPTQKAVS